MGYIIENKVFGFANINHKSFKKIFLVSNGVLVFLAICFLISSLVFFSDEILNVRSLSFGSISKNLLNITIVFFCFIILIVVIGLKIILDKTKKHQQNKQQILCYGFLIFFIGCAPMTYHGVSIFNLAKYQLTSITAACDQQVLAGDV
jgi:hypothetical protein